MDYFVNAISILILLTMIVYGYLLIFNPQEIKETYQYWITRNKEKLSRYNQWQLKSMDEESYFSYLKVQGIILISFGVLGIYIFISNSIKLLLSV